MKVYTMRMRPVTLQAFALSIILAGSLVVLPLGVASAAEAGGGGSTGPDASKLESACKAYNGALGAEGGSEGTAKAAAAEAGAGGMEKTAEFAEMCLATGVKLQQINAGGLEAVAGNAAKTMGGLAQGQGSETAASAGAGEYYKGQGAAQNTLKDQGLATAVAARNATAEKYGESSFQVVGMDDALKNYNNPEGARDDDMGLSKQNNPNITAEAENTNAFAGRLSDVKAGGANAAKITDDADWQKATETYNKLSANEKQVWASEFAKTQANQPAPTVAGAVAGGVRTGSEVSTDGNNYGYGNPKEVATAPAAPVSPPATAEDPWKGMNAEVRNSDAFKYYAENGDAETAKAFREATSMKDLASRIGALEGEPLTAAEVNKFPADARANLLASALEVEKLDSRIGEAARAGTLTDANLRELDKVDGGDPAGITRALAAQETPDQRKGAPATTHQVDGQGRIIPNDANGNPIRSANNTQNRANQGFDPSQMMRQLGQQGQGQQGGGGQSNPYQNPYQNPFNQQQNCPVGTQLSYFNGQQACISTNQQNQCPVGYTAAYNANANTGLFGNASTAVTCVATGTAGNTCPTGQVPSVQSNGVTLCVTQTATNEASVREQAGYLDGVRVKGGTCGLGIDPRFSTDSNYLAGYNRGQSECRSGTGTGNGTTITSTTPKDISDARVRLACTDQLGNVSKELKDTKGLFAMLFRETGTLSEAERKALGFDETLEKRLTEAKNQFDAGKADAVSTRALDSARQPNVAYREGYACGAKIK